MIHIFYLVEIDEGLRASEEPAQVLPEVGQKPRVALSAELHSERKT